MYVASTHDPILFFTNRGRVYQTQLLRDSRGRPHGARARPSSTCFKLDGGEKVTRHAAHAARHWTRATTWSWPPAGASSSAPRLDEFTNLRKSGLIAIVLREDDDLIGVAHDRGQRAMLLIGSRGGMAIRFPEERDAPHRPQPPWACKSIELDEGDEVVDMSRGRGRLHRCSRITENGYGKRTAHRRIPRRRAAAARASRP